MIIASALWRRLDTPGHDAARLDRSEAGWRLEGTAVFLQGGGPAHLDYVLVCDQAWCSQRGHVHGWLNEQSVDHTIERLPTGSWMLDGELVGGLEGCVDLDFEFTPATNLLPLKRLKLEPGHAVDAPAAWFTPSDGTLQLLPQRFERRGETTYWYESPSAGYAALLEVAPTGFVLRYPGLWESVAGSRDP